MGRNRDDSRRRDSAEIGGSGMSDAGRSDSGMPGRKRMREDDRPEHRGQGMHDDDMHGSDLRDDDMRDRAIGDDHAAEDEGDMRRDDYA
jgi:hypothetical protein